MCASPPPPCAAPSGLASSSGESAQRVARANADLAEGALGTLGFELTARQAVEIMQTFAVVHDGVSWFAHAADGVSDDHITLRVRVIEPAAVAISDDASDGNAGVGGDVGGDVGSDVSGPRAARSIEPRLLLAPLSPAGRRAPTRCPRSRCCPCLG